MQKTAKVSIIIIAIVGAVAIAAGVISTSRDKASGLDEWLGYIPADSPLVVLGDTDEAFFDEYDRAMRNANPQDMAPVLDLLEQVDEDSGLPLLGWLIEDYVNTSIEGGYEGLRERYGLDLGAPYAAYLHGAAPVLRFSLSDSEALRARLDEAQAETGISLSESTLGSATFYTWPLDEERGIDLGLAVDESSWTLSLRKSGESAEAERRRFAREPVSDSLAGSERIEDLRAEYADADQFMGYLDFHRLIQALLQPEENSTGREMLEWFPEWQDSPLAELDAVCRQEYVALAERMPRLTTGSEAYSLSGDSFSQTLGFLWQIDDEQTVSALQKLQGHLPAYTRTADDKLAAYGLGVDVSQLVPVLTDFWTRFTSADFECGSLRQLQQEAQAGNPAMLSMATGMLDSVRGAGVALFDLEPSDRTPAGVDGSALVSISSEDPQALVNAANNFVPMLSGTQIPGDGSAVEIPDPMGLGGNFVAIKGSHLVLYRGEAGKTAAEALEDESLESNGLTAFAFNAMEAGELLETLEPALTNMPGRDCAGVYYGLLSLTRTPMAMSYRDRVSERGTHGEMEFDMVLKGPVSMDELAGDYRVSTLGGRTCEWQAIGTETLERNGQARFSAQSQPDADCDTHESEHEWGLTGSLLSRTNADARQRSDCDASWEETDNAAPADCGILNPDGDGFYCTVMNGEEFEIYRYDRQ